jgi:hypothetical protein
MAGKCDQVNETISLSEENWGRNRCISVMSTQWDLQPNSKTENNKEMCQELGFTHLVCQNSL